MGVITFVIIIKINKRRVGSSEFENRMKNMDLRNSHFKNGSKKMGERT